VHPVVAVILDLTARAAEWWLRSAFAIVAVVVAATLVVFLVPLWRLIRARLLGGRAGGEGVTLDGLLEEGGRSLGALAAVRKAVQDMAGQGTVVTRRLIDYLIAQAWNLGASDLHFTPVADGVGIQLRIDGILYDLARFPRDVQESVLIRLKILSRLNVYKRDVPQDGRISVSGEKPIDIRVSTLPTIHGEKAVLRFLRKGGRLLGLDDLGLDEATLGRYSELIARPQGTVLVTGPTGSGKTTTIYASLEAVKRRGGANLNIVTIEDPVEYEVGFLNQTQVNDEVGLTFAKGLRSLLRQDPNVILVGEIRDRETADIAMHAGLTGHLIFSTVHAESSAGVFARLLNMGIEPYILASATSCVIGQRLLRKLCQACRRETRPTAYQLEQLARLGVELAPDEGPFHESPGCERCVGVGVRGRIGIFELLVVDDAMQEELVKEVRTQEIVAKAVERGMRPLVHDGLDKARRGLVSLEEVLTTISTR
jgi:general secretion pathway protein E